MVKFIGYDTIHRKRNESVKKSKKKKNSNSIYVWNKEIQKVSKYLYYEPKVEWVAFGDVVEILRVTMYIIRLQTVHTFSASLHT